MTGGPWRQPIHVIPALGIGFTWDHVIRVRLACIRAGLRWSKLPEVATRSSFIRRALGYQSVRSTYQEGAVAQPFRAGACAL